jgi:hypothetical protein
MGTKANALQVPVRSSAILPWRWTSRVVALALALARALAILALGLSRSSKPGPAKAPGQVVQPLGGGVAPAQPVSVGGTVCGQCR